MERWSVRERFFFFPRKRRNDGALGHVTLSQNLARMCFCSRAKQRSHKMTRHFSFPERSERSKILKVCKMSAWNSFLEFYLFWQKQGKTKILIIVIWKKWNIVPIVGFFLNKCIVLGTSIFLNLVGQTFQSCFFLVIFKTLVAARAKFPGKRSPRTETKLHFWMKAGIYTFCSE